MAGSQNDEQRSPWRWLSQTSHRLLDLAARQTVFPKDDIIVPLGPRPREGSQYAVLSAESLWQRYSLAEKCRILAARTWSPSRTELMEAAEDVFRREVFGAPEDAGEILLELMRDHWQAERRLVDLTEEDSARAKSLCAHTVATNLRFRGVTSTPPLNLSLLRRSPLLCATVVPMVVKIPVVSLRHFLTVDVHFAFNEIRRSRHPHASELIALIYETLFLQQKVAVTLLELLRHATHAREQKGDSLLVGAELDAIRCADLLFAYEKASIEKSIAIVGQTLGVNLESKKTHKKRLEALRAALPQTLRETPYGDLLLSLVSSDSLEQLNAHRSGLLHKRGISELQPHRYVGASGMNTSLSEMFVLLHEQHAKNTAVLVAALALLTDELVRLCPPDTIPSAMLNPHPSLRDAISSALASAVSGEAGRETSPEPEDSDG